MKLDGGAEAYIQDFTPLCPYYTDKRYQQYYEPYKPAFYGGLSSSTRLISLCWWSLPSKTLKTKVNTDIFYNN